MFLGLDWYWWLIALAAFVLLLPLKLRFLNKYASHRKKKGWDDEHDSGE